MNSRSITSGRALGLLMLALVHWTWSAGAAGPPEALATRWVEAPVSATANGDSGGAVFSGDGRFVLFASTADDLVTRCHNGLVMDLFVRELASGAVSLLSVTPDGGNGGNAHTYQGAISADGRFVVFESAAGNLVADDGDQEIDCFLRDREAGTTRRLSPPFNAAANFGSPLPLGSSPAISADGRRAAFVRAGQLYVHDVVTGVTTLVTRAWNGGAETPVPGAAYEPQFAADGSRLAFRSTATLLTRPPASGFARPLQLFVCQFSNGRPSNLIQLSFTNPQLPVVMGGYPVAAHSLSADGHSLVAALAPPSGMPTTTNFGVYRFNLETGTREQLTPNLLLTPNTSLALAATTDAATLAIQISQGSAAPTYTSGLFIWTSIGGLSLLQTPVGAQLRPLIATPLEFSADGTKLLYLSNDTNLVAGLPDSRRRPFLREIASGQTVLAADDAQEASGMTLRPDGLDVVFESGSPHLTDADLNEANDLFLAHPIGGPPALLTPRAEGTSPGAGAGLTALAENSFSADGRFVVFTSFAGDLVAHDDNRAGDVFRRDLLTGEIQLVSVDRDGVAAGNGHSGQPALSADGRWVAFLSGATNLVDDDTNGRPDLFLRDLQAGRTTLVSRAPDGSLSSGTVAAFGLSRDGRRVAFQSNGNSPGSGAVGWHIYLRELPDGPLQLISGHLPGVAPVLSADGSVAGFIQNRRASFFQVASGMTSPPLLAAEGIVLGHDGSRAVLFDATGSPQLARRNPDGTYSVELLPEEPAAKRRAKDGVLSADDRWLTYAGIPEGTSSDAHGGNLGFNIYLRDLATGHEVQINRRFDGGDRSNGDSDQPSFSPDGRFVIFRSAAGDLVPDDDNAEADVFVHDRLTGCTRLVTRQADSGAPLAGRSYRGFMGADATKVWLHTVAADAVPADFNSAPEATGFGLAPDNDADGLDDDWELANFGNLDQNGAGDFDQDTASNAAEFAAGTRPKDPASQLAATLGTTSSSGDELTLSWPAVPGKRYRVMEVSFPSEGTTAWRAASGVLTAFTATLSYGVQPTLGESAQFYTLAVAP